MPPVLGADPSSWLPSLLQGLASLWPLWLPLAVGALAIFWLLPRPRAYPWMWGALAGLAALLLAGGLVVRTTAPSIDTAAPTVLFYAFAAIAVVSGALLVTQCNPARAALSFALVVLSTSGLFLLLAAPFLMAATIIVYAGAIIVTFLFVLMLAQQQGLSTADSRSREPLLSTITGFVLLGALLYVLKLGYDTRELDNLLVQVRKALAEDDPKEVRVLVDGARRGEKGKIADDNEDPGKANDAKKGKDKGAEDLFEQSKRLIAASGWKDLHKRADDLGWDWIYMFDQTTKVEELHVPLQNLETVLLAAHERMGAVQAPAGAPLSGFSGAPANTPPGEIRRNPETRLPELPGENSAYLGRALFTDFLLPVELGGMLLLVATIGAIAIGQRRGSDGRALAGNDDSSPERTV